MEELDVLIVGAGISGIGAACHLKEKCPELSYAIFEGREALGGTWDLFRYPGIRSDSDMYTLGFAFRPWKEQKAIADGSSILRYLEETAREEGVERHIRFRHRVVRASWSSDEGRWTVEATRADSDEPVRLRVRFLFTCTGYYDYARGYTPELPGLERFGGRVVHPQHWTDDIDTEGRRVVVIGSGATAVTLVPALAERAAHVTMLQRSPTYILSVPAVDPLASALRERLPSQLAYDVIRWKNVLVGMALYQACRRFPGAMRKVITSGVAKALGPEHAVDPHFNPTYDPWDQRLCLVPDADLFEAIRSGRASVVTDHIETFTETGIRLRSGRELEADVVVTATGLRVLFMSGIELTVDGRRVEPSETTTYKGMMLSDVPNLALWVGYTNASWTLKADLTSEHVCRLLRHMARHGHRTFVPRLRDGDVEPRPLLDLDAGYVRRALGHLPRQGSKLPWRVHQNYLLDLLMLRYGPVDDDAMELGGADEQPGRASA